MDKVKEWLLNLNKDENYFIVSVSGGADSMALLSLLNELEIKVVVVHFNHQTRKENDTEQQLVHNYTKSINYPFHTFKLDVPSSDFQNEARNLRLSYLKEIADKYKTPYILTAHHLDDLAETIIMTLTRGSSLFNLSGFKQYLIVDKYIFLKPLLEVSKKDILEYINDKNIPYLDDPSNFEDNYFRNRVRNHIIPLLKEENPKVLDKFLDLHYEINSLSSFVKSFSDQELINDKIIDVNKFRQNNEVIQINIITNLLEKNDIIPSKRLISLCVKTILNDKPNSSVQLSDNLVLNKSYNYASVLQTYFHRHYEKTMKLDEKVVYEGSSYYYTNMIDETLTNIIYNKLCYNNIVYPIITRNRLKGDRLNFKYGSKKLKDFLIEKKIPLFLRDKLLIFADSNNEILWIPNLYLNETLGSLNTLYFTQEKTNKLYKVHGGIYEQKTK